MNMKKTAIAAAISVAAGMPATASALTLTGSWDGVFTLLNPAGTTLANGDSNSTGTPWYGWRTPVVGTLSFDTSTGAGTGTVAPFSFQASGFAAATTITFQAIGNGFGGAGNLVLGNMGFNWAGNNGIPVSIVLDATGFYGAGGDGYTTSETITGGATPYVDDYVFGNAMVGTYTLPVGPSPMATTTWNTATIQTTPALGDNPSGTLPLTDDGIGGSPMGTNPFPDYYANFDITTIHIDSVSSPIPVPAAVWLFGSGLLGLVGVARRRKKTV
jgi:hypothetical protein